MFLNDPYPPNGSAHDEKVAQHTPKGIQPGLQHEDRRPREQDEGKQAHGAPEIDIAEHLDPLLHAHVGGIAKEHRTGQQDKHLHKRIPGNAEQVVDPFGDERRGKP